MSRTHVAVLLAFSTLLLPVSICRGQATPADANASSSSSPVSVTERNVPHCQAVAAPGGSRIKKRDQRDCAAGETIVVRTEQELSFLLEVPQDDAPQCAATMQSEYDQRNTVARVTGTLSVANCPANSAATYYVVARIKDESGEIKAIEFPETRQHGDGGDAPFTAEYPIGENVELVNVRIRDLKCTCAAAPEAAPAETATPN